MHDVPQPVCFNITVPMASNLVPITIAHGDGIGP